MMKKFGIGKILRNDDEERERKQARKNFTESDREALRRENEDESSEDE